MDIFKRINHNNLKQDKRKSLTLIIAIAISTCLFTMVATFMMNIVDAVEESIKNDSGNYYISMSDKNDVRYNKFIKNKDVEHIMRFYEMGEYMVRMEDDSSYGSELMAGDKKSLELMNLSLEKGKLPTNSNEIIIPKSIADELGEKGKIGKNLSLEMDNEDNINKDGNVIKQEFKIVGYYDNEIVRFNYSGYRIFCGYDSENNISNSKLYIKLKNGIFDTKVKSFIKQYNISKKDYELNEGLLEYTGINLYKNIFTKYMLIFGFFYIVILIVSIVIISNAIMISYNNQRRQMGLLATVGATKKQLINMILSEVGSTSLIGVPVGIIFGELIICIISKCFINYIRDALGSSASYNYKFRIFTVLLVICFDIITVLLAIIKPSLKIKKMNIIESAKENDDINIGCKKIKESKLAKKFSVEGVVADKYYRINNKKYRTTMRGLAFSMVIFIFSIIICDLIDNYFVRCLSYYDYDVKISTEENSLSDTENAYNNSKKKYSDAKNTFSSVRGVENKYFYCEDEDAEEIGIIDKADINKDELRNIKQDENAKKELPNKIGFFIRNIYVDENMYKNIIKKNNLDKSKYLNNSNPKGILYNVRQKENSNEISPIITRELKTIMAEDSTEIYAREEALGKEYDANYEIWPILEPIDMEGTMENNMQIIYKSEAKGEEDIVEPLITKNIEVGDIINTKIEGLETDRSDVIYLIYPDTLAEKVNEFSVVIDSNDYNIMKYDLDNWIKDNDIKEDDMGDIVLLKSFYKRLVLFISAFAYIFVILMTIMAIANVLNIISTNFYYRRRDYAMIQSVGMSDKGLRKMLVYECLNYGIRAFMTGLPISIILSVLIKLASGELKSYFAGSNVFINILTCIKNILPWGAVGISVLVIFAVVFLSMLYSIHEIKKESIIDTIKSTDI